MAEQGAEGACGGGENPLEDNLAMAVFEKLKGLDCPFLKGLHLTQPETMKEVLCDPSKYRLDILQWIYIRACPSSKDVFSSLAGAPDHAKINAMKEISRGLFLPEPIDQILLGRASALEQLHFLDDLLDMIWSTTPTWAEVTSVEEQCDDTKEENKKLLEHLYSSFHLRSLLRSSCEPRALATQPPQKQDDDKEDDGKQGDGKQGDGKQDDGKQGDGKQGDGSQRAKPSVEEEEDQIVRGLAQQLQKSVDILEALQTEHEDAVPVGRADPSILQQKLRLVVSDFHQLILAFLQVYDKELTDCCQLNGPYVHPCGPIVEAVCKTLISCRQILKATMEVASTSALAVGTAEKQQQGEQDNWSNHSMAMSLAARLEELIQKYKLVSKNLKKKHQEGLNMGATGSSGCSLEDEAISRGSS